MGHLNKKIIDAAKYEGDAKKKSSCTLWDDDPRGLGVRVSTGGKKSWILKYRLPGSGDKQRFMKLGDYPTVSLQQARQIAKANLAAVAAGGDPAKDRREEQQKKVEAAVVAQEEEKPQEQPFTVKRMAEVYIDLLPGKARRKPIGPRAMKEYRRIFETILYPSDFAQLTAVEVTRDQVIIFHQSQSTRPRSADYLIQRLRAAFNEARRWGLIPYSSMNPFADVPRQHLVERDVWVKHEEIPRLVDSINQVESPVIRGYFLCLLYMGQRRSETARLKWSDIDFARRTATFRETKNKQVHVLPLNESAIKALESIPRLTNNPYVFHSAESESGHLESPKKQWDIVRQRAGLEHITLHDLRRTHGCLLACEGVPLQHIAQVLNHKDLRSTQIYARLSRTVSEKTESIFNDTLVSLIESRSVGELIPLPDAKKATG